MTNISIALTCADYPHVMPLATGAVRPDGIDLTLLCGNHGSWPMRADMLNRAIGDPAIHGGEASLAGHVRRIDQGDRSFVGIPAFILRNFTARDLYVRKGGPVRTIADLAGKRVGMYSWTASGSVWYRHFLRHIGVKLDSLRWWIGDIDGPTATPHGTPFPPGVELAPPGRALSEMLIQGEIDMLYSPPRPRRYHPVDGPIVRLVPDIRAAERDYFEKTGCFPPQHLVILRRAVWALNPWIARSLTGAFARCHDQFAATQRGFPYASPWLDLDIEEADSLMGAGFEPHGLNDHTRREIEAFCDQAHRAGLTRRRVGVDECFEEFLGS